MLTQKEVNRIRSLWGNEEHYYAMSELGGADVAVQELLRDRKELLKNQEKLKALAKIGAAVLAMQERGGQAGISLKYRKRGPYAGDDWWTIMLAPGWMNSYDGIWEGSNLPCVLEGAGLIKNEEESK